MLLEHCFVVFSFDHFRRERVHVLEMFRSFLPQDAFYGRGSNCDEERSASQFVWSSIKQYPCTFHILQQIWRWLHGKNHRILQSSSKPSIYIQACCLCCLCLRVAYGNSLTCQNLKNCFELKAMSWLQNMYINSFLISIKNV